MTHPILPAPSTSPTRHGMDRVRDIPTAYSYYSISVTAWPDFFSVMLDWYESLDLLKGPKKWQLVHNIKVFQVLFAMELMTSKNGHKRSLSSGVQISIAMWQMWLAERVTCLISKRRKADFSQPFPLRSKFYLEDTHHRPMVVIPGKLWVGLRTMPHQALSVASMIRRLWRTSVRLEISLQSDQSLTDPWRPTYDRPCSTIAVFSEIEQLHIGVGNFTQNINNRK